MAAILAVWLWRTGESNNIDTCSASFQKHRRCGMQRRAGGTDVINHDQMQPAKIISALCCCEEIVYVAHSLTQVERLLSARVPQWL